MVENRASDARRFDGTYSPHKYSSYLHFDSWRLNLRPGVWLPAYIYSEESDLKVRSDQTPHFKAPTRLWGYDLRRLAHSNQEFTQIQVDSLQTVRDESESAQDTSPIEAERVWERQAEENGIERLQKIALLAPSGEVDKVLETVVNNLIVTNNLTLLPDIHCRVLLTEPLSALLNSAPQLETRRIDQIAALPYGGRVRLDPWSNRVELLKAKPVALLSAHEKMPFEVTPFFPYLTRLQAVAPDKIAVAPSAVRQWHNLGSERGVI